jgi:TPP-dependent pyruvate/acetoin dehydrogenase alpha subunit
MLSAWAERDPVARFRAWLVENVGLTEHEDEELHAGVKTQLNEALRRAEASPLPDPATVAEDVYA